LAQVLNKTLDLSILSIKLRSIYLKPIVDYGFMSWFNVCKHFYKKVITASSQILLFLVCFRPPYVVALFVLRNFCSLRWRCFDNIKNWWYVHVASNLLLIQLEDRLRLLNYQNSIHLFFLPCHTILDNFMLANISSYFTEE